MVSEQVIRIDVVQGAEDLVEVREQARRIAAEAGLNGLAAAELSVAVSEAAALALHESGLAGDLKVEFGVRPDRVHVVVGRGAEKGHHRPRLTERDLSVALLRRLSDAWQIVADHRGMRIVVEKRRSA